MQRVNPGDTVRLSASAVNRWNETAEAVARMQRSGAGEAGSKRKSAAVEALGRNDDTGSGAEDIARWSVVSVVAPAIDPASKPETFAAAEAWSVYPFEPEKYGANIGIALEAMPAGGGVRRIAIGGHVRCRVTVTDDTHTHAMPIPGGGLLQSGINGFPIIWKASAGSGGGEVWAEVDFTPRRWRVCKALAAIPADSVVSLGDAGATEEGVPYRDAATYYDPWEASTQEACPYPAGILSVSPGAALATGDYFLAPVSPWPTWARCDDAGDAEPGMCAGLRKDGEGAAELHLPGLRVIDVDAANDRIRVIPEIMAVTGAITTASASGFAEAALVEVVDGTGERMQTGAGSGAADVVFSVATYDEVEE